MDLIFQKLDDTKEFAKEYADLEKIKKSVEELSKSALEKTSQVTESTRTKITELSAQVTDVIQLEKRKEVGKEKFNAAYQACVDKLNVISSELAKQKSALENKVVEIRELVYASAKSRYLSIKDYSEKTLLPVVRNRTASTAVLVDTKFGVVDIVGYLLERAKQIDNDKLGGRVTGDVIVPVYSKAKQLDQDYIGGTVSVVVSTVTDDFKKEKEGKNQVSLAH